MTAFRQLNNYQISKVCVMKQKKLANFKTSTGMQQRVCLSFLALLLSYTSL